MGPAGGRHTNEWKTSVNSEGSGSPRKNLMGEHLPFTKFKMLRDMPVYAEGGTHPPDVRVTTVGPSRAGKGVPFLKVHTGHLSCPEEGQTYPRQNPDRSSRGSPLGAASQERAHTGTPIKVL